MFNVQSYDYLILLISRLLSARLQYLQCVSDGDSAVSQWLSGILWFILCVDSCNILVTGQSITRLLMPWRLNSRHDIDLLISYYITLLYHKHDYSNFHAEHLIFRSVGYICTWIMINWKFNKMKINNTAGKGLKHHGLPLSVWISN